MDNNTNDNNQNLSISSESPSIVSTNEDNSISLEDQPVILESMTVPLDLPVVPNESVDYGSTPEIIAQDDNNVLVPSEAEVTFIGGTNDESTNNDVIVIEENNIPESIQIPIMTPEGDNINSSNDVEDNNEEVNIPKEENINIKVGALSKLSKKKKKEKEKQLEKEALQNGKLPVKLLIFPIIIIIILIIFIIYLVLSNNRNLQELRFECSPINFSSEEKKIDINSTIVQELYSKVKTNIREDIAQPEWNDQMKIYLAYRQIIEDEKYDSNCNLFDSNKMEPYTCFESSTFKPLAFTADTLRRKWKLLYGEDTDMPLINIKLENSCIGGYEYIPKRDEFVQGYCEYHAAPLIKVNKKLVEASVIRNTLILKEEVRYIENEKINLPSYLVSGDYYYTFRLDMNYNYVFISKKYNDKY